MKWLLITDFKDIEIAIKESLKLKDKTNKFIQINLKNLGINLSSAKKNGAQDANSNGNAIISIPEIEMLRVELNTLDEIAGCMIYSQEKEFDINIKLVLANLSGILMSNKIPVLSNVPYMDTINLLNFDLFHVCEDYDEFLQGVNEHYQIITDEAVKRISKKRLLNRGIPFTSDCFGNYIAKDKIEIINEFLAAGMGVNVRDDTGTPMLNIACRNDNYDIVEMLLDLGAELNAVSDDRGYTAVMDAIWRGNEKITKFLISKGAELNTINKEGQTNLILAVGADRLNLVKLLAENGADPDVKDMMGMSAYNYATLFRKEKIVEVLKPYHKEI